MAWSIGLKDAAPSSRRACPSPAKTSGTSSTTGSSPASCVRAASMSGNLLAMRHERITDDAKGWFAGPWDSDLAVSVGFANACLDEPHLHSQISEIYLVARGTSSIRVEDETVELRAGDALIVEPGEAHTFLSSSDDYLRFVVHTPGLEGDAARSEKQ